MLLINELTDDFKQKHSIILPNGRTADLILEFKPQQTGWFMSLTYLEFTVTGYRVTCSPNFTRQFKNLIPFGIACFVDQNQEPMFQEDFSSGRAKLYLLTSEEVAALEAFIGG